MHMGVCVLGFRSFGGSGPFEMLSLEQDVCLGYNFRGDGEYV